MAEYVKMSFEAIVAENSSYSPVKIRTEWSPYAPSASNQVYEVRRVSAATTPGTTVDLGAYTNVTNIVVLNTDSTNYVDATFRTNGGGSNDQVLRAVAGDFVKTGGGIGEAADLVLIANTAACVCEVFIAGAL